MPLFTFLFCENEENERNLVTKFRQLMVEAILE